MAETTSADDLPIQGAGIPWGSAYFDLEADAAAPHEVEKEYIVRILEKTGGSGRACPGIDRKTLYRKLAEIRKAKHSWDE